MASGLKSSNLALGSLVHLLGKEDSGLGSVQNQTLMLKAMSLFRQRFLKGLRIHPNL